MKTLFINLMSVLKLHCGNRLNDQEDVDEFFDCQTTGLYVLSQMRSILKCYYYYCVWSTDSQFGPYHHIISSRQRVAIATTAVIRLMSPTNFSTALRSRYNFKGKVDVRGIRHMSVQRYVRTQREKKTFIALVKIVRNLSLY